MIWEYHRLLGTYGLENIPPEIGPDRAKNGDSRPEKLGCDVPPTGCYTKSVTRLIWPNSDADGAHRPRCILVTRYVALEPGGTGRPCSCTVAIFLSLRSFVAGASCSPVVAEEFS